MPKLPHFRPDHGGFLHLYHYTCAHAAECIRRDGMIKPYPQFRLDGEAVVWLADYRCRRPGSESASRVLGFPWPREPDECDKTLAQIRVRIQDKDVQHWPDLKERYPDAWHYSLAGRGAKPWLWWMTTSPIFMEEHP